MSSYIGLMNWTDLGVRDYKETVDRFEQAKKLAVQFGTEIKETYWTPGGPYDLVCIMECPDQKRAAAFGLLLESMGNLRMTCADAYGPDEMRSVLAAGG
jgi:uncharacterized protein with GYD domain